MDGLGLRYSVGVVGRREHFGDIAALREALPRHVYLWVNALAPRRPAGYYPPQTSSFLRASIRCSNSAWRASAAGGVACLTGETAIAVDGDGEARRCHFVPDSARQYLCGRFRARR